MRGMASGGTVIATVRAFAKINLTLEVLEKRPDGYHDIASVMQTVDLSDTLFITSASEITLICDSPGLNTADNLVLKAAHLLQDETGVRKGAQIHLKKGIPVSAGLGGGSSDVAATLKALNGLWKLGLHVEELLPLALRLGSDVPFFLKGGTAIVGGRGENVRPLPAINQLWLVIVVPPNHLAEKTGELYRSLTEAEYTDGSATHTLEKRLIDGEDVDSSLLFNVFEMTAFNMFSGIGDYRDRFLESGAGTVRLSGTGPSLYSVFEERTEAERITRELASRSLKPYLTSAVNPPNLPPK